MGAPLLSFSCFVTDRLERYSNLNNVTVLRDEALRIHEDVDAHVFAAPFRQHAVTLNAERIEEHLERFSLVVKSVEVKPYIIVLPDVVSLRNRRPNLVRFIKRAECDIQEFWIVTNQNLSGFRRRSIVTGGDLVKVL